MLLSADAVFGGYGAFRRFKRVMTSHKTFENKESKAQTHVSRFKHHSCPEGEEHNPALYISDQMKPSQIQRKVWQLWLTYLSCLIK